MSLSNRDVEDLKGLLNDTVKKFLGFNEPSVVSAALNCISTGYDKRKTVDKLSLILDGAQASVLAERVHNVYEEFKSSGRSAKKRRRDAEEENQKKRRFIDEDMHDVEIPAVAMAQKPVNTLPNLSAGGGVLAPDKIKEMMANAQRLIQERKAQLQAMPTPLGQPPQPPSLPPPSVLPQSHPPSMLVPNSGPTDAALNKAKRAAELQAQIKARLSGITGLPPPLVPGLQGPPSAAPQPPPHHHHQPLAGPSPLILNAEGKTIDAKTGEAVQLTLYTPTLKANIRAKRREQFKGLIERPPEEISESKYFDPRVSLKGSQRNRRGFKFHEKGKFEQQASRLRAKAQLERLQAEISLAAKKTGIASAAKIATITPKKEIKEGEVPDIEWWDSFIIRKESYDFLQRDAEIGRDLLESVTHLVEHPSQIDPPVLKESEGAIPIYLTKGERKKLRRQNRREAEKELQEKIRLGLAPPMEPKVRMANLMRVLGTEAVQDPTKVEAHVRAQMAKRQRAHEEANAARKLTVEQRKDKKMGKIKEDTSQGVHVAVYRVRDLTDPAIKFKIEKNASQLFMTGLTILYKDCNVVVVEGGPKQQRKFKQLMLHRIRWEETHRRNRDKAANSDDDDDEDKTNKCFLVWEGMIKGRSCSEMKMKLCPTPTFAREQLKKLGIDQYWDLAYSGAVLDTTGQDGT